MFDIFFLYYEYKMYTTSPKKISLNIVMFRNISEMDVIFSRVT